MSLTTLSLDGSTKLWATLNEDWKGGCPIRLSFGSGGFFWGEKEWIEPNQGHLVQAFGMQPPSLIAESKKRYPGIKSFQIDFVALGAQGSWVMGTSVGEPCWSGISDQLEKTLKREMAAGHKVKASAGLSDWKRFEISCWSTFRMWFYVPHGLISTGSNMVTGRSTTSYQPTGI